MSANYKITISTTKLNRMTRVNKSIELVQGRTTHIEAQGGERFHLQELQTGVSPKKIITKRVGKQLHIQFEGSTQPDLIIDNYYDDAVLPNELTGTNQEGDIFDYVIDESSELGALDGAQANVAAQVAGGGFIETLSDIALPLGLAVAAGGAGVAYGMGGGSKNTSHLMSLSKPIEVDSGTVDSTHPVNPPAKLLTNTPKFSIHSVPKNMTAQLIVDGKIVDSVFEKDAQGNDYLTPKNPLSEGMHTIFYQFLTAKGKVSGTSLSTESLIDTIIPYRPEIQPSIAETTTDNGSTNQTESTNGPVSTRNTQPNIAIGQVQQGTTPKLVIDGKPVDTVVTTDEKGNVTLTPKSPIGEGEHTITYHVVTPSGRTSSESEAIKLIVDTTPPDAPKLAPDMTADTDEGVNHTDNITSNLKPHFMIGVVPNGLTAQLVVDGKIVAATVSAPDAQGNVFLTPVVGLLTGSHALSFNYKDAAGNVSQNSPALQITTSAEAVIAELTAPVMTTQTDTGSSQTDAITGNAKPTFSLNTTIPNGAIVQLLVDGVAVESTLTDLDNVSYLTPVNSLSNGKHAIAFTVQELSSNAVMKSPALDAMIMTEDTFVVLNAATDDGVLNATDVANNLTVSGVTNAPIGTVVTITGLDNVARTATVVAPTSNRGSNTFSVTIPSGEVANFSQGSHTVTVSMTDPLNRTSTDTQVIVVDTKSPNAPAALTVPENSDGHITVEEASNGTLIGVSLAGTNATAGDKINVSIDGVVTSYVLTSQDITNNTANVTVPKSVLDAAGQGSAVVTATITNAHGNTSVASPSTSIMLDAPNHLPTGKVTIAGTAQEGQVLTASNTLADADGMGTVSYKWYANGAEISGATSSSFVLSAAQIGKTISAKANYTDGQGTAEVVVSNEIGSVIALPPAPVPVTPPAPVNQAPTAVTLNNATTSLDENTDTTNHIKVADIVIADDNLGTNTVTLSGGDASRFEVIGNGLYLKSGVTLDYETQASYNVIVNVVDSSLNSAPVTASYTLSLNDLNETQPAQNHAPTGNVTITGTAEEGQTLTASNTLADADGMGTVSYKWYANGAEINGATATTYTLTSAEVGKKITVKGNYTDGGNTAESVTSSETVDVVAHITPPTPVNQAPTNTVPNAQTTDEDTVKVITGLQIADTDAGTSTMTVTLAVVNGVMGIQSASGVTITSNNTSSVQLNGALADINTLLSAANAVTYKPNSNYNGNDSLTMTTSDGSLSDTDNVTITVTPINDAPIITVNAPSTDIYENTAYSLTGIFSISDVDVGAGVMTASLNPNANISNGNSLVVNVGDSGVSIINNYPNAQSGYVYLKGTLSQLNALLAGNGNASIQLTITDGSPPPTTTMRLYVNDNGYTGTIAESTADIASFTVHNVNNAPVLDNLALSFVNTASSLSDKNGHSIIGMQMTNLTSHISDDDANSLKGIAITGANHGTLYYIDSANANEWLAFNPTGNNQGKALLLDNAESIYVKFVPESGYAGDIANAITFRAWDQTAGTNETYVDTSTNGGTTAFSSDERSVLVKSLVITSTIGAKTNDTTPTFSGQAAPNSEIDVYDDDGLLWGATTASAAGQWEYTFGPNINHPDLGLIDETLDAKSYKFTFIEKSTSAYQTVAFTVDTTFIPPIVLDLNQDGVLNYSQSMMDVNGDGQLEQTAWAGKDEGVLIWDKYADGQVHDNSQYAFAQYGGKTDLSGLAAKFDTNHDGTFNAQDAQFDEFAVWQDANQNGVSDSGEVYKLSDIGMMSLKLNTDNVLRHPVDGVREFGQTSAEMANGSSMLVADVAFEYSIKLDDVLQAPVSNVTPLMIDGQLLDMSPLYEPDNHVTMFYDVKSAQLMDDLINQSL